ncbi:MAG: twin-arginine translocation signal domain-containing protein [Gammaproteobacteria bacterium]
MSVEAVIDRRQFLHGATGVLTGVLGVSLPLVSLMHGRAWAVDLHVLNAADAATLNAMVHCIAPHDGLDEAAYALVIAALDTAAAVSTESRAALLAGIKSLGMDFAAAGEPDRIAKLEAIESSPFFQSVRLKTVMVLYDNPIAWAHFGYEGEAFSKGGYLTRGFNDLKWLPEVPLGASGPMPV